jgi:hypothetical protein
LRTGGAQINRESVLNDPDTPVGSARINEKGKFVKLYINNGKVYKISVSLLEELVKGKKQFIEVLANI